MWLSPPQRLLCQRDVLRMAQADVLALDGRSIRRNTRLRPEESPATMGVRPGVAGVLGTQTSDVTRSSARVALLEPEAADSSQRRAVGLHVSDAAARIALLPVRSPRVRAVGRLVPRLTAVVAKARGRLAVLCDVAH